MRHVPALLMAFLVLTVLWSPAVLAGETRTITGFLRLDHDAPFDPNVTFNLSDPDNMDLLNWNQTVEGFQDDSGIVGSFTGPFLPPMEALGAVNKNDVQTLSVCGKVRFKTEWVMSGSSESWWRVPERGPYYGDNVNLTIWRVGSPDLLNFTDAMVPNSASHPTTVFNNSYDLVNDTLNDTFRWYNTTAWNHTFNSTWVRVVAPIHGDDFYAVRWEMTNRSTWAEHWLRFSQNDIGDDRDFSTWVFYPNGTREFVEADLDFSVIHTNGHGYSVWGTLIEQAGGGGGGDAYYPSSGDDMTESLTPTGTEEGGRWDGDWTSTGTGLAVDAVEKTLGSYSIKCQAGAANQGLFWGMDTSTDVSGYDLFRVWVRTTSTMVRAFIYDSDNEGYYKDITVDASTWTLVEADLGDWSGWSISGTPDLTIWSQFKMTNRIATSAQLNVDEMYFVGELPPPPGPDLEWNVTLEEPITNGDYLTVLVPFLETVDNTTNVLIGFGTQNDSWSTAFWVAENGPTDFGIKSVQWDVVWEATEMKVHMTIYNTSRRLWVIDRNTLNDPDVTWEYNRYSVEDHAWAPDDYYFGGVPYHVMQITNGSWENAMTPPAYFVGGREVRPGEVIKQNEDSDDWYIEIWLEGYEGMARVTTALSFARRGQWEKASAALNPEVPFPTDAGWFYGKYIYPAIWAIQDFVEELGVRIWSALVWIYEGIQWVVENAPWVIAGTIMILTFFVTLPVWARFYRLLQGLIRFGWTIADKGLAAGAEFAEAFWDEYISTSYVKKAVTRFRRN